MNDNNLGIFGWVSFPITLAFVLTVLSAALIAGLIIYPGAEKQLTFTALVIGGAAAIYTGYYTAAMIRANTSQAQMAGAFACLRELNRMGYFNIRTQINKKLDSNNLAGNQISQTITDDPQLLELVNNSLASFEDTSVAIQAGYVDEKILYYCIRGTVCWSFSRLKPYVEHQRTQQGVTYLIELERLVDSWKNRCSLVTGKPYETQGYLR